MKTYKITKQADKLIASRDASFNGNTKVTINHGLSIEEARKKLLEMYNNDWGTDFKDWSPEPNPESPFAYGQHPYGSVKNEDGTVSYTHNSRTYSIEEEIKEQTSKEDKTMKFLFDIDGIAYELELSKGETKQLEYKEGRFAKVSIHQIGKEPTENSIGSAYLRVEFDNGNVWHSKDAVIAKKRKDA